MAFTPAIRTEGQILEISAIQILYNWIFEWPIKIPVGGLDKGISFPLFTSLEKLSSLSLLFPGILSFWFSLHFYLHCWTCWFNTNSAEETLLYFADEMTWRLYSFCGWGTAFTPARGEKMDLASSGIFQERCLLLRSTPELILSSAFSAVC